MDWSSIDNVTLAVLDLFNWMDEPSSSANSAITLNNSAPLASNINISELRICPRHTATIFHNLGPTPIELFLLQLASHLADVFNDRLDVSISHQELTRVLAAHTRASYSIATPIDFRP